jgi:uncharacterized membrane protein
MPVLLIYLLVVLAGLFALAILLPLMIHLLVLFVLLAGIVFWLTQLIDVMQRRDDEFPGRYDKIIWALVIVLGNIFGAFAYWIAKPIRIPRSSDSLRNEFKPPDDKHYSI